MPPATPPITTIRFISSPFKKKLPCQIDATWSSALILNFLEHVKETVHGLDRDLPVQPAKDAFSNVRVDDSARQRIHGALDRRDLGENVLAGTLFLDHPADTADLTLDSVQPENHLCPVFFIVQISHGFILSDTHTGYKYHHDTRQCQVGYLEM